MAETAQPAASEMEKQEAPKMSMEEQKELQWKEKMGPVDGVYLPPSLPIMPPWKDKIAELRQMTLRDDDVILLTYQKAGTHWLYEVIHMLRRGTSQPDKFSKVQTMMELISIDVMNSLPSPRTLNTHLMFKLLPVDEIRKRKLKLVHVYRNPKDVLVSFYYMTKSMPPMMNPYPAETFSSFLRAFEERPIYGWYFDHMRQMHEFQQQNPDVPFYNLAYEDVKKDAVGAVRKLAQFLEVDISDQLCADIAEACSFENMKKDAERKSVPTITKKEDKMMKNLAQKVVIFRKGQTGSWKNDFTVADSERMDKVIAREMKDLPFTLTFE